MRHEAFLLDSAFNVPDDIAVIEHRRPASRATRSDAPTFAAEIEALLAPIATDGMLIEVIATNALMGRRRGEAD